MRIRMLTVWLAAAVCACGGGGGGAAAGDPGGVPADDVVADLVEVAGEDAGGDPEPDRGPQPADDGDAAGEAGEEVADAGPDAPAPVAVGTPCTADAQCAGLPGGICMTTFEGGYCAVPGCQGGDCPAGATCIVFNGGTPEPTFCLQSCEDATTCRPGYGCDASVHVCWGKKGLSPIGGACIADTDCVDDGAVCYPSYSQKAPTGFVNGYCVAFDCTEASCPAGSACRKVGTDGTTACLPSCATSDDCRRGYVCDGGTCYPGCAADADCPGGTTCDAGLAACVDDAVRCGPDRPAGWCPEGLYCIDQACREYQFTCSDTTFEPNETRDAASAPAPGAFKTAVRTGLQVCNPDQDWFRLDIPKGNLATLGLWFNQALGDLDLCAYEADGTFLGCRYDQEDYPASWRGYEYNDEFLSALAAGADRTVYFKADGYKGATNVYDLYAWLQPWRDGPTCTDAFSQDDCRGCLAGGSCVKDDFKANLVQFPFADPADPYVGDGYRMESSSGYRWVRRETAMLIRYGIHQVQRTFPGTTWVGLIDMGQIDGITPGFDVGDPRHPESTHDEGGNIDVAYFRTDGPNTGGVICDPKGGSTDGYYCTSVANHVVDLPRTAVFLGALAESPRFRVVGCDKLIAPLLLAELKVQKEAGHVTEAAYQKLAGGGLAYGDGWPFHHHHVHVSLQWWGRADREPSVGCGFRMPGDGTLEGYRERLRRH